MTQIIRIENQMTTHIKSINRKVWKMVETKIEIGDPENLTMAEEAVTEPTNYMKLSKKIIRQSRRFSKLKPV